MQLLLIVISINVISFTAMACPDLSGEYSCVADGITDSLSVQQKITNNVTTYTIRDSWDPVEGTMKIIADGNFYALPDDSFSGAFDKSYRATCLNNVLTVRNYADYVFFPDENGDTGKGQLFLKTKFRLNLKGELSQEQDGYWESNGAHTPISWSSICTPLVNGVRR